MDNQQSLGGYKEGLFQTNRPDYWWIEPLLTGLGFLGCVCLFCLKKHIMF